MKRTLLVTLASFCGVILFAAIPGQPTHTGPNVYENEPVDLRNQTFSALRIKGSTSVQLHNVTITEFLVIGSSDNILLEGVRIGTTLELFSSEDAQMRNSTVNNKVTVLGTQRVYFLGDALHGDVRLYDAKTIWFERSTVDGCLSREGNSEPPVYYNMSAPRSCPPPTATTPSPTSHVDYYCDGQFQSTPCTTTPTPSTTPKPTDHYDYYCNGQFQATPCETAAPPPPNKNYTFELVGKQVYQDVWVSNAESVLIRDSQIFGNLGIGWSSNIVLEGVYVSGKLQVEHSERVEVRRLNAGPMFGMANTRNFQVTDAFVGGLLGCYRCSDGVYNDVRVQGQVVIVESSNVERINVQSASTQTPEKPLPLREARPGVIMLNVTNSSLEFAHRKVLTPQVTADVQLGVNALNAVAKLEVPSLQGRQGELAIHLESRFEKLQEFEDRDGNGAYDLGDLVVREYLIDDLPIAAIRQERLGGDDEGWVGRIEYALPDRGTLALIFTARENSADQTKIDVEISNYEYATRSSQLALQIRIASASDWTIEEGETEDRLLFNGTGLNGYFSWVRTAVADGADSDVTARVLEEHRTSSGEREIVLILGYARASNILHDPSIGVVEAASLGEILVPQLGNILVYGTTFVAIVVVLWAMGHAGTGKRRSRER